MLIINDAWEDLEFEVALDSWPVVHVCAPADCPGYLMEESLGSRQGQEFLTGDGGCIPNLGQMKLNLLDKVIDSDVQSIFQIAAVTRPLMSVGRFATKVHRYLQRHSRRRPRQSWGGDLQTPQDAGFSLRGQA